MTVQYRELVLLEKLQELTAPDADFDYSVLRGKMNMEEVQIIREGLQVAIEHLQDKLSKGGTMTEAETQPNGPQTHYLRYGDRLVLVTDNGVHAEFGLIRRVDVERNVEYPLVKGWCSLGGSRDLLPPRAHYTVTIKTES